MKRTLITIFALALLLHTQVYVTAQTTTDLQKVRSELEYRIKEVTDEINKLTENIKLLKAQIRPIDQPIVERLIGLTQDLYQKALLLDNLRDELANLLLNSNPSLNP